MRYLSVCSGIEAASAAWEPLGWEPLAFSEIEPAPRKILKHRFPTVPLHGDFTKLRDESWIVDADVLVGGTPCQSFSVAGLRGSLSDDRGNLTLEYVRLANAIDDLRRAAGRPPAWVVWENVPGVLSTSDNAFGSFLGGLVGSDAAIEPAGGGWDGAGVVAGPRRVAAWRTLDAQFFGVAQRRRRVFVLALGGTGGWAAADALLPFLDRREWHPATSREKGQRSAGGSARSVALRGREGGGVAELGGELAHALRASQGGGDKPHALIPAVTAKWAKGSGGPAGDDCQNLIAPTLAARSRGGGGLGTDFDCDGGLIAHTLRADGFDASEAGTGRGTPLVAVGQLVSGNQGSGGNRSGLGMDEPHQTLTAMHRLNAIAFHPTQDPISSEDGTTHAMGTGNGGGCATVAVAFAENSRAELRLEGGDGTRTGALNTGGGKPGQGLPHVAVSMAVRRITPREAERLQGFQDDWTRVPVKHMKEPPPAAALEKYGDCYEQNADGTWTQFMADGPRYKALGNSMAVPVVRYLGERIAALHQEEG